MINEDIIKFFSEHCESDGVPNIDDNLWHIFMEKYSKDDIRQSLAEYIHRNNVPFPWRSHPVEKFITRFKDLCYESMLDQYEYKRDHIVKEKHDYKYKYEDSPLGIIDKSHLYNVVSDYFQQQNRLKCDSISQLSPYGTWKDKDKLSRMNWTFWRMDKSGPRRENFLASFRLGTYTATQFRPSVAKALYEKHNAINVLDTSCGWGDRLAGFYATKNTERYVGCDPNPDVYEVYKKQCVEYEILLGNTPLLTEYEDHFTCVGKKSVEIWRKPSEDVNWDLYLDTFDFYFTSPPYFATEKYAADTEETSDQSWARYNSFDAWKYDFFFKVTHDVWRTINKDGYMMINIIEPRTNGNSRHKLCDDMVDYFMSFDESNYIGKIGMRMMARPHTDDVSDIFIEPIWVFRKGNDTYEKGGDTGTLDSFFG